MINTQDDFSTYYQDLLEGQYDCVDRIVVNAYFPMGQQAGGFRFWWRKLAGSDETLDKIHQTRMAGRFKRRLEAGAKARNIPFVYCEPGERKHEKAEEYFPKDPKFKGVFLIMIGRAPAPIWEVLKNKNDKIVNLYRKKNWPYVNYYYFHLMDPEWGHVTIRMSGYPPFGAQVILNGHEWVERSVRKIADLPINKEGNCFTGGSDFQTLDRIAKTLRGEHAIGRLSKVCDRWIYSACLCFALSLEEQERSEFRYQYSIFQLEYSRNLLFKRGRTMDEIYEKVIDRTRRFLDVPKLKTIFGRKNRPQHIKKLGSASGRLEKEIDGPNYDLTVFKVHFGKLTLKIYDKGDRVLRIETVAHNVKELRSGCIIEKLPKLLNKMAEMLVRFLNIIQVAHKSFIDDGSFAKITEPTKRGNNRLSGIDLNKPRIRKVCEAIVALSPKSDGFTINELTCKVQKLSGLTNQQCNQRQVAYDLLKLRGKEMVHRKKHTQKYIVDPQEISKICALIILQDKVIKPIFAGVASSHAGKPLKNIHPIDVHYQNLQKELRNTFKTLGIAA